MNAKCLTYQHKPLRGRVRLARCPEPAYVSTTQNCIRITWLAPIASVLCRKGRSNDPTAAIQIPERQGGEANARQQNLPHAKPSDFNDIEDMTVQSIFPDETEVALKKLSEGFHDVILAHLNDPPTYASPMREMLAQIQQVYRSNPTAIDLVKTELVKDGAKPLYDVEHLRARATAY
jgi:hypothetical protein